jgi:hypothetical protein
MFNTLFNINNKSFRISTQFHRMLREARKAVSARRSGQDFSEIPAANTTAIAACHEERSDRCCLRHVTPEEQYLVAPWES